MRATGRGSWSRFGALLLGVGWLLSAPPPTRAASDDFDEGVEAYLSGDLVRATEIWSDLAQATGTDAAVQYNLGNAYYRLGDDGRAVLHWERARRLRPDDDDVVANLALVRARIDASPRASDPVAELHAAIDRRVSVDATTVVCVVALHVLGLATFVMLFWRGRRRRVAACVAVVAVLSVAVVAPVVRWQIEAREDESRLVIVSAGVELRTGPGERFTTLAAVPAGLLVEQLEASDGWFRVQLPDGRDGWLESRWLERV